MEDLTFNKANESLTISNVDENTVSFEMGSGTDNFCSDFVSMELKTDDVEKLIKYLQRKIETKNKTKYCWLDIPNGKFTDSWDVKCKLLEKKETLQLAKEKCWKLIEYKCINDDTFSFTQFMKLK